MQPDDELCLCFHVTKRKVVNYLRIEKPQSATQLADCHGAGTGCGWCRPFLKSLFEASRQDRSVDLSAFANNTAADYAARRSTFVKDGSGTPPPGATPID